jgi:cation diffusion facilitator family transporter
VAKSLFKKKRTSAPLTLKRVVVTSFLFNFLDVAVNSTVAILSGSVTMLAQALEGAADLLSSGLLLIGVKLSSRPADHNHPYGYGRELFFWTFLAGLATFTITATFSIYSGINRLIHPEPVTNTVIALIALSMAIITNGYAFSLSYRRLMKKSPLRTIFKVYSHSTLIETKTTFALDLMGTTAPILGLLSLTLYLITGNAMFDGIGAILIGVSLAGFALVILKAAKDLLVGQAAHPDIEQKIKKAAESFEEVQSVLDLRTVQIGPERILVNLEIHMKHGLNTLSIEKTVERIEHKIRNSVPSAAHILIELDHPDN